MCGIAGIVDPRLTSTEAQQVAARMAGTLIHRGPDDDGFFASEGVGLGMRRLSIIDVAGGKQPITNEDGLVQVICNGEIYNYRTLRAELETRGHKFRTSSDVEVIAHLYEEKGPACVEDLHGMFALAIWDDFRQRLVLARDRLGKKPLFFAQLENRLLFGSEIKAVLAGEPVLAQLNVPAVLPYLRWGFVPEPDTMFRNVRKLQAAHRLIYERGSVRIEPYWQLEFEHDAGESKSAREWADELDDILERSVEQRLMSEVPLGVFLSGGLDSSAMVAYAHRAGLRPLKTFTIGFDRPEWDESADALLVARHFDTEHHVLRLDEQDMKRNLPDTLLEIVRHIDEPLGDQATLPTYFVSKLAREHVTVILSGDGGDELFAGYNSYQSHRFADYYRLLPEWIGAKLLPGLAERGARYLPRRQRYRAAWLAKLLSDASLPFDQSYYSKTTYNDDANLRGLLSRDLQPSIGSGPTHYPSHIQAVIDSDWSTMDKQCYIGIRLGLLEGMLVKVDRMSMAHSLEVRCPILDHRLVEFAARLPAGLKLRGWEKKAILRDVVRPQLPTKTLRKRKQGFRVPLREWLRTSFDEMAKDYLCPGSSCLPKEVFNQAAVDRMVNEHRSGRVDHSVRMWILLNYAAWHDQYIAQSTFSTV